MDNFFPQRYQIYVYSFQMKDFFAKYPEAGAGEIPRKQALETVQTNIDWLNTNKNDIDKWL